MMRFFTMLWWDICMQARHNIYTANVISTVAICGFILLMPLDPMPTKLATAFVFMDPAFLGLSFIGAIVLAEKSTRVLAALGVTPSPPWIYILSKTTTLSITGTLAGIAVAWVAYEDFNYILMTLMLILSNIVAVLIGFGMVARAKSMNGLMISLLYITTLLFLPLLAHFDIVTGNMQWLFAIIPSHAMLLSFSGAVDPSSLTVLEWLYAITYQAVWIFGAWKWSLREYNVYIISDGK